MVPYNAWENKPYNNNKKETVGGMDSTVSQQHYSNATASSVAIDFGQFFAKFDFVSLKRYANMSKTKLKYIVKIQVK